MAEIQEKGDKAKKGKQKKMSIHIDFTPMVDMNMLLITFFMLCSTLNKPQTMEISMPSRDKVEEEEQTKVKESQAITLILDADDALYYYQGIPDYDNYQTLKPTTYTADGLRSVLIAQNRKVVDGMQRLKQEKLDKKITQEQFEEQAAELKKDKSAPVVMIKSTDEASYKNLIDVLDEMQICSIARYAIVDITDGDQYLLLNYKSAGELTKEAHQK
jgi:biopolymer transport protein ExbD